MHFHDNHDEWVPVTTARRVLRLRMEERPSDMDGGGEYIKYAVADSRHRVVLQPGGLSDVLTQPHHKNVRCYEAFHKASDLDGRL
jgi:hypothetical protein